MGERKFDAVVIGGGSGGLAFARTAARQGARVAVVERGPLGGTCVNRGCVPKKLLWHAGHALRLARGMQAQGIWNAPKADFATLRRRIDAKIDGIRDSYASSLEETGVELFRAEAKVFGPDRVEAGGHVLSAERLVLASGASPVIPDFDGHQHCETSDDLLNWSDPPKSAAIIGGGYIGCEFAAILRAFGVRITLIEEGDRLLGEFDAALGRHAADQLREDGVDVVLGAAPVRLAGERGRLTLELPDRRVEVERVVAAIGRRPQLDALGPLGPQLGTAESGTIAIDDRFRTSEDGVFAIGDAADRLPLTPVATRDGETLARQLFGDDDPSPIDLSLVATAAFLYPPHAQVGDLSGGTRIRAGKLAEGVTEPDTEVGDYLGLAVREGRITGMALACESAADAAAAFATMIACGTDETAIRAATGIHPSTIEEIVGS